VYAPYYQLPVEYSFYLLQQQVSANGVSLASCPLFLTVRSFVLPADAVAHAVGGTVKAAAEVWQTKDT
jgi:hypothetical protein